MFIFKCVFTSVFVYNHSCVVWVMYMHCLVRWMAAFMSWPLSSGFMQGSAWRADQQEPRVCHCLNEVSTMCVCVCVRVSVYVWFCVCACVCVLNKPPGNLLSTIRNTKHQSHPKFQTWVWNWGISSRVSGNLTVVLETVAHLKGIHQVIIKGNDYEHDRTEFWQNLVFL